MKQLLWHLSLEDYSQSNKFKFCFKLSINHSVHEFSPFPNVIRQICEILFLKLKNIRLNKIEYF